MFGDIRSLLINFPYQEIFLFNIIIYFDLFRFSISLLCNIAQVYMSRNLTFLLVYHLCWTVTFTINFIDHLFFLGKVLTGAFSYIDLNLLFYLIHLWICQFYLSLGTISFEAMVLSIFLIWCIVHVVLSSDPQLCKKTEAPLFFIFFQTNPSLYHCNFCPQLLLKWEMVWSHWLEENWTFINSLGNIYTGGKVMF